MLKNCMLLIIGAGLGIIVLLLATTGCKRSPRPAPIMVAPAAVVQSPIRLGESVTVIAEAVETVEVPAIVYEVDDPRPQRRRVLIQPGVWLLPPSVFHPPSTDGIGDGGAE